MHLDNLSQNENVDIQKETVALITYMRTDNKKYSKEFIKQIIPFIKNKWEVDNDYINNNLGKITIGKGEKKDKNAQEAHEAIRPTNISRGNAGKTDTEKKHEL